jgi:hypothetical protein
VFVGLAKLAKLTKLAKLVKNRVDFLVDWLVC